MSRDQRAWRYGFADAMTEREEEWRGCGRSPTGRHVRDGESCRYCGALLEEVEEEQPEEE